MTEPFVGQIISAGFNFAPVGWFLCDGSLKSISEFEVLYTLIGTTYGGNGQTTFAVPDLRGRTPLCQGQGAGLPIANIGQIQGSETVTIISNQVGLHGHALMTSSQNATSATPGNTMAIGVNTLQQTPPFGAAPTTTTLAATSIGPSPPSVPHENRQPLQCVNYIIAFAGIFPSQS